MQTSSSSGQGAPSSQALPLSPIVDNSPAIVQGGSPHHQRKGSEPYYEDMDPRFAVEEATDDGYERDSQLTSAIPNTLTPGGMHPGAISGIPGGFPHTPAAQGYGGGYRTQAPSHNPDYLHPSYSYGAAAAGTGANDSNSDPSVELRDSISNQGSERASEASHFTSISERPVNPNWSGSESGGGGPRPGSYIGGAPPTAGSAAAQRRQDVVLAANPDFSIPGVGAGRGGVRGRAGSNPAGGFTPGGRYPTEF